MNEVPGEERVLEIYRATVDALYGYASRKCGGDRALAEDVVQETWLRAIREWRRKGLPRNPLGWLVTVAHNLAVNHLRRRNGVALDAVAPEQLLAAVDDDGVGESVDAAAVIQNALARLPAAQVRLIDAFHYQRMRVAQIAEQFGVSERAIEGRLRRARERLRQEVELVLGTAGRMSE